MSRRAATGVLLAGVMVLGLAGCGVRRETAGGGGLGVDALGGQDEGLGASCTETDPMEPVSGEPVPADFAPVFATRCLFITAMVPGDGEWLVRQEQEARADLSALLAELRKPGAKPGEAAAGGGCPAVFHAPVIITLVDGAGRSIVPVVPKAVCGEPMPSAVAALKALPWLTVHESNVRQMRSELEVTTGCSHDYKPEIDLRATDSSDRTPTAPPVFASPPSVVQVCRYALTSKETISTADQEFLIGTLAGAPTLRGPELAAAIVAMNAAPPVSAACTLPQAPFAVLFPVGGSGPWIMIELGGCHRMLDNDGNLRQLPATFTLPD